MGSCDICGLLFFKHRFIHDGNQIGGCMIDYSESYLAMDKALRESYELLLKGNQEQTIQALRALAHTATISADWLEMNKRNAD